LENLRVNPEWAKLPLFERKGWKKVRFGDVVENVNETCNPKEAGIERFIAMEHLEPGSLHVKTWGNVDEGTTFTRRCREGQVLFGKRRAYQKKVAVAEFEAVVSGDIYVFSAKKDRLSPRLLSSICLSDSFFKYAIETSAGSLSPRTNWSSLKNFELMLPPMEIQVRLEKLLIGIQKLMDIIDDTITDTTTFYRLLLEDQFSKLNCQEVTLLEVCGKSGIRIGPFGSQLHASDYVKSGIPVVMPSNLDSDEVIQSEIKMITPKKADELSSHKLEVGDILLPRRGDLSKIGFVGERQRGWICGTGTIRVRHPILREKRILFYALSRPSVSEWLTRNAVGTTMPNLNSSIVEKLKIGWPKDPRKAEQMIKMSDSFMQQIFNYRDSISLLESKILNQVTYSV
jgi:type I restriction enzyme S subunit